MTSRWGRSFEYYVDSYGLQAARARDTLSPEPVADGLTAINKICSVMEQTTALDQEKASAKVTMSDLRSASKFLVDPQSLRHLKHESLVSGCIKLMKTVKPFGKYSPFSFEYGYLCFRLMTIALGLCLLQRFGRFDAATAGLQLDTNTELLLVISTRVAAVIQEKIELLTNGENQCDAILGWVPSKTTSPVLVSREDARVLLTMLWEDRRLFLEVFMSTYSPGLSGVMFVLWRYIYLERSLKEHPNPDLLVAPFCEIQWRYLLVATSDQDIPMIQIGNDLCNLSRVWDKTPKLASVDDTRTMLRAYCERIDPANTRLYKPLGVTVAPVLLRLVVPHMVPGTEGQLPRLFGLTIDRLWDAFLKRDTPRPLLIQCTRIIVEHFSMLIDHLLDTHVSNRTILSDLVGEIAKNDLLELIARMMLTFKINVDVSSEEYGRNYEYRESAQGFFEKLAKLVPQQIIEAHFQEHLPELQKFKHHLKFLALCQPQGQRSDKQQHSCMLHYSGPLDTWIAIGRLAGQETNLHKIEMDESIACGNPRCGVHTRVGAYGISQACSTCFGTFYCSTRCQTSDWVRFGRFGPHKDLCRQVHEATQSRSMFEELFRLTHS